MRAKRTTKVPCKWQHLMFWCHWWSFPHVGQHLQGAVSTKSYWHHHTVFKKSWNAINSVTIDVAAPRARASGGLIIYGPVGFTAVGKHVCRGLYNGAGGWMTSAQIRRGIWAKSVALIGQHVSDWAAPLTGARTHPPPVICICICFWVQPAGQKTATKFSAFSTWSSECDRSLAALI